MYCHAPSACGKRQRNLAAQPFGCACDENNGSI